MKMGDTNNKSLEEIQEMYYDLITILKRLL